MSNYNASCGNDNFKKNETYDQKEYPKNIFTL